MFQKGDVFKQAVAAMSMVEGLAIMVSSSGLLQHMAQQANQLRGVAVQMFDVLMEGLKNNKG